MARDLREDERLADWVDGRLSVRDLERFEAELRVNPELAAAAAEYRAATERIRQAVEAEEPVGLRAPAEMTDRILARIDSDRSALLGGSRRFGFAPWVGSAAAAAAILLVFFVVRSWNEPPSSVPVASELAGEAAERSDAGGAPAEFDDEFVDSDSADATPAPSEVVDRQLRKFQLDPDADNAAGGKEGAFEGGLEAPRRLESELESELEGRAGSTESFELSAEPDDSSGAVTGTGRRPLQAKDTNRRSATPPPAAERMGRGVPRDPDGASTGSDATESQPVVVFGLPATLPRDLEAALDAAARVPADPTVPATEPTASDSATEDQPAADGESQWRAMSTSLAQVPLAGLRAPGGEAPIRLRLAVESPPPRRQVGDREDVDLGRSLEPAAESGARARRSEDYRARPGDLLFELRGRRSDVESYLRALSNFTRRNGGTIDLDRAHPEQVRGFETLGLTALPGLDDEQRARWLSPPADALDPKLDVQSLRIPDRPDELGEAQETREGSDTLHRIWIVLRQRRER